MPVILPDNIIPMPVILPDNTIQITTADIREDFGAFVDSVVYPDATISSCIEQAKCFISDSISGCGAIDWKCRALMIELMTCHLLTLMTNAANSAGGSGGQSLAGLVQSASIGDVSVSAAIPENKSQLQWYLNQTHYGQQLFTLLSIKVSPLYFGGSRQRIFNKWR